MLNYIHLTSYNCSNSGILKIFTLWILKTTKNHMKYFTTLMLRLTLTAIIHDFEPFISITALLSTAMFFTLLHSSVLYRPDWIEMQSTHYQCILLLTYWSEIDGSYCSIDGCGEVGLTGFQVFRWLPAVAGRTLSNLSVHFF